MGLNFLYIITGMMVFYTDPLLAQEENTREFGITLPFGTKSPESFADSEDYVVVTTPDRALRNNSISCTQGLMNDESWSCERFETSHIVCGHYGVFTFVYPNYAVSERAKNIRMQVRRTGGGFGDVFINYFIKHFTTNDSDLIATAAYTTSQRLSFENGALFKIRAKILIRFTEASEQLLLMRSGTYKYYSADFHYPFNS